MKQIFLVGVGGISAIAIDIIRNHYPGYDIGGFYDDDEKKQGKLIDGIMVLGAFRDLINGGGKKIVFNCLGNIKHMNVRRAYSRALREKGFELPTLAHPRAMISSLATIGEGGFICPNVVVNAHALVGGNAVLFSGAVIEHHAVLGDDCYVSPLAAVCGKVVIGKNCYLGPGAILTNGVTIGDNVIIGAGAVVLNNLPGNAVYVGTPARFKHENKPCS